MHGDLLPRVQLIRAAALKHSARNVSATLSSDLTEASSYPDLAKKSLFFTLPPTELRPRPEEIIPPWPPHLFLLESFPAHTDPSCPSIAQENMGWHGLNWCQAPG